MKQTNPAFHRIQTSFCQHIHPFPLLFSANAQSCGTGDQEEKKKASTGHTTAEPGGPQKEHLVTPSQLLTTAEIFTTITQQLSSFIFVSSSSYHSLLKAPPPPRTAASSSMSSAFPLEAGITSSPATVTNCFLQASSQQVQLAASSHSSTSGRYTATTVYT